MHTKSIFVYLMKPLSINNSKTDLDRVVTQEVPLILCTILILRSCWKARDVRWRENDGGRFGIAFLIAFMSEKIALRYCGVFRVF